MRPNGRWVRDNNHSEYKMGRVKARALEERFVAKAGVSHLMVTSEYLLSVVEIFADASSDNLCRSRPELHKGSVISHCLTVDVKL